MSKRLLLLSCLLVLSALAFVACGSGSSGGEEGEVEEVIETSATSTDPADCKRLATQQFIEQTTRQSGTAAIEACEEDADEEEAAEAAEVSQIEVDGSIATAEAALTGGSLDGQAMEVELVKEGDGWKMNEVVEFTDFDHAKLIEALEAGLSERSSEIGPRLGSCVIGAFEGGSQAEVEELLFGKSTELFEEVVETCASERPAA